MHAFECYVLSSPKMNNGTFYFNFKKKKMKKKKKKTTQHIREKKKANIENRERERETDRQTETERGGESSSDNAVHQTLIICFKGIEKRKEEKGEKKKRTQSEK